MTIAKNATSKLFVAMVAAAMVFTLATPAKAATAEELQAQIDALMAQISGLQGGGAAMTHTSACTFTRPLTVGSKGADVKCLQDAMTPMYFTNAGGSTGYFGLVTKAAVAKWQAANGVMPAVGYFGPVSQAKFAAVAPTPTPTPTPTPGDDGTTTVGDDSSPSDLSGEASLKTFLAKDGDDTTLEESQKDGKVVDFDVKFTNGDAKITRLDIGLQGKSTNVERKPWNAFDTATIWVDGKKLSTVDLSDKTNYLKDTDGTVRLTGLDIIAKKDKTVTLTVALTPQSGVVASATDDWTITGEALRFSDGSDVTTTENAVGDLVGNETHPLSYGNTQGNNFTLAKRGVDDQLKIKSSSADPASKTIEVKKNDNSGWISIFAFDLDTKDSINDITVNTMTVNVLTGTAAYNNVIRNARLTIDGTDYTDFTVTGGATTSAILTFDIRNNVKIVPNKKVTAVLAVKFNKLDGTANTYSQGETVQASTSAATGVGYDASGAKDLVVGGKLTGSATGELHTLRTRGLSLKVKEKTSTQVLDANTSVKNYGNYTMALEFSAFGEDAYVPLTAVRSSSSSVGIAYAIEDGGNGIATTSGTVTQSLQRVSGGTVDNTNPNFIKITDGDTATFNLVVTYDPDASGQYRVQVLSAGFGTSALIGTVTAQAATPVQDFETANVQVAN